MAADRAIKVLLVVPWIRSISGLRAALSGLGLLAEIVRVDFEAALRVALAHHHFDVAVYATTPGLGHEVAVSLIRQQAPRLAIVQRDDLARAATEVAKLVRERNS